MALTLAQKQTLKTHALANQATVNASAGVATIASLFAAQSLNSGDAQLISDWYNALTSPAVYSWHFSRSRMDNRRAIMNVAGAGNQLDGLTQGKRDSLIFGLDDTIDCRLVAVRTTIEDWCGSQNTLKAAILDSFKRQMNNLENVFATGTGSFAAPKDGTFQGTTSGSEISDVFGVTV